MATGQVPLPTSPRFTTSYAAQAAGRHTAQQEALPAIFHGGVGPNMVKGGATKQRLVAQRTGAPMLMEVGQQTLLPTKATLVTTVEADTEQAYGKKTFANAPGTGSVVDSVVFGKEKDGSGESQFHELHEDARNLYNSSAGIPSGKLEGRPRGLKSYLTAPGQQSQVDTIIWGRDLDFSDQVVHDPDYIAAYGGAAGKLANPPGHKQKPERTATRAS